MKFKIMQKNFNLAEELWPINRSITGEGLKKTLRILKRENKELKILKFKSSNNFDWQMPLGG